MDVSAILTMAQTVLQLLDSSLMKEIQSVRRLKSQLAKIKDTMSTIKAVLVDAEKLQVERSEADLDWLKKLRDAVYEADDLFDKIATLAQREKLMDRDSITNKVCRKVQLFVSHSAFAFNASREISRTRERLDDIAKDRRDFGSSLLGQQHVVSEWSTMRRRREESHSFVHREDVIGRDEDKKAIINMLLDTSVEENVSFIAVVGMGGLGKTTLSQLVYNDETIEKEFPLKLWVCVSDVYDLKAIVRGILEQATKRKPDDLCMDLLQRRLQEEINGNKYLLVLDDVWNEDREKWLQLRDLLIGGGKGSRIVVTTRSEIVAKIIGNKLTYRLRGLSQEDSWRLFERMAFGEREQRDTELIEIGKEIVRKCDRVPLAVRVSGSLLYGQDKSKWLSFKNDDLASIKLHEHNPTINILKLSYYHLSSPLKSCFNYCAVFPKDFSIQKDILISLWMAQGFILPSYGCNLEEVGQDYFMTLLERCFFQDVTRDDNDEIISCKIHDLMHDVAKEAAGAEIVVANSIGTHFDGKIRHLSMDGCFEIRSIRSYLGEMKGLRTLLKLNGDVLMNPSSINEILLSNTRSLRALQVNGAYMKRIPKAIDKLLHLRYLDLSYNNALKLLPASITMLHNLQTLKLLWCTSLKELPRDLSKLVNLRCLNISHCNRLTHMPPGMNNLTCLQTLPMFLVGTPYGYSFKKVVIGQLEELKALKNLRGDLEIKFQKDSKFNGAKVKEVQCVRSMEHMEHLRKLRIEWDVLSVEGHESDNVEALLEGLQPHHNLTSFELCRYPGTRFPSWASLLKNVGTPLSNLVQINFNYCEWLQNLPSLSQLPFLKTLSLLDLMELEYVESNSSDGYGCDEASALSRGSKLVAQGPIMFFPSLEKLILSNLPKFKAWWRLLVPSGLEIGQDGKEIQYDNYNYISKNEQMVVTGSCDQQQKELLQEQQQSTVLRLPSFSHVFPRLSYLSIWKCPNLNSIPLCPNVEELTMIKFNEALGPIITATKRTVIADPSSSSDSPSLSNSCSSQTQQQQQHFPEMKSVAIDNIGYLKCLIVQSIQHLASLSSLTVCQCKNMKSLPRALEHLTALNSLALLDLPELDLNEDVTNDIDIGMCWESLSPSLRSLKLRELPKLVDLPNGMQNLTALQYLSIESCQSFQALPGWISCLSSLQSLLLDSCPQLGSLPESMRNLTSITWLKISGCSDALEGRCRAPDGVDFPKICHIPHFIIKQKLLLKLDVHDYKCTTKAMRMVSKLPGIDSCSMDWKEKIMTVTGDPRPADIILSTLRRVCQAEIVSIEPMQKK